ncbi:hypothetical protein PtA15_2A449 [Puccinia triticina]|uniref:Glucosamine/galactosamine-6-phosphate isomerase domain-containing protein n=1 Tax=Puccinia triticina TaxID=208348 RepID=A0ABY7CAH8_9BASI|nr:uncharacterized protein PtA15_2A449 [Puccinia triticina]WAQ82135.1 hypothetical protein PtA15_2A449 [Puccinia triticina]
MGPDRHICLLFPSHELLNDKAIMCNDSPQPPAYWITMILPVLNAFHELVFICAGPRKDTDLDDILDQEPSSARTASLAPPKPCHLAELTDSSRSVERGILDDENVCFNHAEMKRTRRLASSFDVQAIDVLEFGHPHRVYPAVYRYTNCMLTAPRHQSSSYSAFPATTKMCGLVEASEKIGEVCRALGTCALRRGKFMFGLNAQLSAKEMEGLKK